MTCLTGWLPVKTGAFVVCYIGVSHLIVVCRIFRYCARLRKFW